MEREFTLVEYRKDGTEKAKHTLVMREISSDEAATLRRRATIRNRDGTEYFDGAKYGYLVGARMIVSAPFESEDGKKWTEMDERQKVNFLGALGNNYEAQLTDMVRKMNRPITEEEENL